MRLLAVIEATNITGPAKNLLQFACLARLEGVETTIATFTRGDAKNLFVEKARDSGIAVETIPEQGAFDLSAFRSLAEAVRRLAPDIVQTHAVKSHFLARLAGIPQIAPWVAFHHGYTWPTARARAYNQLDRWSLRAARKVLTVSKPFRDELIARGVKRDRIEIVHNAISPEWGSREERGDEALALRRQLGIPAGRKVILIVGRLSREKDHLCLLRAMRPLIASKSADTAPHLVTVGEGPERRRIENAAAELGIADHVTLAGQQPTAEPFYRISDLAVLSSLSEGSPNALLEAMAAGVPVVATAVGGIPEIVSDGESALLVKASDSDAMHRAIDRVLFGEAGLGVSMAGRARDLIRRRHTPEARMRRLVAIYREVLKSA
ncbi:MAG: glycosyltransferase [Acidobacteriota bacterium]|nr:glycosyltransferase [Acidobacteriota bacterium]